MDELNEYSYMWKEKKDKYVLLSDEDVISIICLYQGMTLIFLMEDEILNDLIVEKMLKSGNKVCYSWEEVDKLAISSAEELHEMLRDSDD